jgi:hypothetical protein
LLLGTAVLALAACERLYAVTSVIVSVAVVGASEPVAAGRTLQLTATTGDAAVAASQDDDSKDCISLTVSIEGGFPIASAQASIDKTVSVAGYGGQSLQLVFTGMDSARDSSREYFGGCPWRVLRVGDAR